MKTLCVLVALVLVGCGSSGSDDSKSAGDVELTAPQGAMEVCDALARVQTETFNTQFNGDVYACESYMTCVFDAYKTDVYIWTAKEMAEFIKNQVVDPAIVAQCKQTAGL